MKKIFLFSLVILVFASGCREMLGRRIRGNGHITSETRTASGFTGVDVSGAISVYVKQDSVASIKVEADENLLEYIEVHNSGSTLEIHTRHGVNLRPTHKIKVYVSSPSFTHFEASGACEIYGENEITSAESMNVSLSGASNGKLDLNVPKVTVDLSGASDISIRGKTRDFDAGASGASSIKCFELLTENTDVDLSGASHAEIYASVTLDGETSGASSVDYKGNAKANVGKSGASSVNKKD